MKELEAKVKEIINRNYNVKSFRLEVKGNIEFKAGQFLQVTLSSNPQLKRYLSISSSPTENGYLEFTKKLTDSDFSKTLDNLKPGDKVHLRYPFGKFILDASCPKIAFLSGGIGITPIRSICKYAIDKRLGMDIVLIYANRSVRDIVFREDFEQMQKQYPKLKIVHVLSEPGEDIESRTGRIDAQVIKECVTDYTQRKFYLCGPPGMVEAMKNILVAQLSVAESNIITENFQGY